METRVTVEIDGVEHEVDIDVDDDEITEYVQNNWCVEDVFSGAYEDYYYYEDAVLNGDVAEYAIEYYLNDVLDQIQSSTVLLEDLMGQLLDPQYKILLTFLRKKIGHGRFEQLKDKWNSKHSL